jgi:hypothetical protein
MPPASMSVKTPVNHRQEIRQNFSNLATINNRHTIAINRGMGRGCAICSNPDARRKSVGSVHAAPKKESPIGNPR